MHEVQITTFGYGHAAPPQAHITLDLRAHFRDPHVRPELRYLTARDTEVREAVLGTLGIPELIDATVTAVQAYVASPSAGPVSVAVGCASGRHRAATVGMALTALVQELGLEPVTLTQRDLDKAVIKR